MFQRRAFLQNSLKLIGTLAAAPLPPSLFGSDPGATPPISNTGALQLTTQDPVKRVWGYSIGMETLDRELYELPAVLPALKILPVKQARLQSGWSRTEKVAGVYDFTWLDDCVDKLVAMGIEPWISVGFGNPLYIPEATDYGAVGWVPLYSDTAMKAWLNYVTAVATRYKGKVVYFEIWNEPWNVQFWRNGTPSPQDYAAFAVPTMKAMRAVYPGAKFVTGSVTLSSASMDFAKGFLNAGVADHADVLCFHQYARVPDDYYVTKVNKFRAMLAAYPRPMTLWQGEGGAPSKADTTGVLSTYEWDEKVQAKWLMRKQVAEAYAELGSSSYFHLIDLAAIGKQGQIMGDANYKGLLNLDATPKLAFGVFRYMVNLLQGKAPLAATKGDLVLTSSINVSFYNFTATKGTEITNMIAYWNKGEFMTEGKTALGNTSMTIKVGNVSMLSDFVLFDPMTLSVYKFNATTSSFELPLKDYPLFVVKKTTLQSFGTIVS